MKVKLLKKLRKRFHFYTKPSSSGYIKYRQMIVLDTKSEKEYPVGQVEIDNNGEYKKIESETMQGGIHLAIFLSGYQDRHFKNLTWKYNFKMLKGLING